MEFEALPRDILRQPGPVGRRGRTVPPHAGDVGVEAEESESEREGGSDPLQPAGEVQDGSRGAGGLAPIETGAKKETGSFGSAPQSVHSPALSEEKKGDSSRKSEKEEEVVSDDLR